MTPSPRVKPALASPVVSTFEPIPPLDQAARGLTWARRMALTCPRFLSVSRIHEMSLRALMPTAMARALGSAWSLAQAPGRSRLGSWKLPLGLLVLSCATVAHAENLVQLLDAAKAYDAAYLAAQAQAESVDYQDAQAHALHRPNVALQAALDRNHFDSSSPSGAFTNPVTGAALPYQLSGDNTTRKVGVVARQPIYNPGNSAKIEQADASLNIAQADLQVALQDLIVRLTQAYFDVLSAQDVLHTTQANKTALAEQLAAAKRSFEVGNATITDTREAQARFDLANAQDIAAANDLRVKQTNLEQLVGMKDVHPNTLRSPVNLQSLAPGDMQGWLGVTNDSPLVRKAQAGLDVATLEIDKARAGHLPTLDAVASILRNDVGTSNALTKVTQGAGTTSTIGLELNLSLYAGNSVQNRIAEVLLLKDKAEHDLDNAKRSVGLGTRQAYFGVESGLAQVQAYEAAESSAKLALEATQLGYHVGVRINKDVLDAQTQLANTQKDLYKARYDVIVASVRLKQANGILKPEDLDQLNRLLVP